MAEIARQAQADADRLAAEREVSTTCLCGGDKAGAGDLGEVRSLLSTPPTPHGPGWRGGGGLLGGGGRPMGTWWGSRASFLDRRPP